MAARLRLGGLQIIGIGDPLVLRHGARRVIEGEFTEAIALHCVDRQLQGTLLDFVLGRKRLAFTLADLGCLFQRKARLLQRLGHRRRIHLLLGPRGRAGEKQGSRGGDAEDQILSHDVHLRCAVAPSGGPFNAVLRACGAGLMLR